MSVDRILPGLYLGDLRAAQNQFTLKSKGVTHILQAMGGFQPPFKSTFTYKVLQVMDVPWENLGKHFWEAANFIRDCIKSGGTVFVHW